MSFSTSFFQNHPFERLHNNKSRKSQDYNWVNKLESLDSFQEMYGHTNVPQRYTYQPYLGPWVGKQRGYFLKSKLLRGRIESLKKLNFNWAPGKSFPFDSAWNKRFKELQYFKTLHGHCNVPCKFGMNKELGYWVKNQRQFYKKGSLQFFRINLLNGLGFEWTRRFSPLKLPWKNRFEELKNHFYLFGTTKIRQRSGPLGKWVQKQRDLFKKNKIDREKKDLLDSIHFDWKPKKNILGNYQIVEKSDLDLSDQYYPIFFFNKFQNPNFVF
ncbi:hypothetical protein CMESO_28 (nucleomorph) [Chroomonas mesostigmatica CCMP1168]|uniref:Helicase-associated domain-containing protein n=1 Tax=Chroomonas mesostigmatica CCMP1168 TaxID=1195612 RepID=J7G576_9CRYP|nr:hypothetical protein CMESO_28 [Chroomonas mesostigmatica CCMP1168]|mmetsp:Transcript_66795/g.164628  ORF Transcript_66795/g.164628 Transcript_66795/m.164628 type:complete len:270 (-) Transcript_66795:159-968(-)